MTPVYVSGAVEGISDEPVLRRVVEACGGTVHRIYVRHGKANLRRAIPGYNLAARRSPWLVLVDLDHDFECPAQLTTEWLSDPAPMMRFRVAVRQVESWLMADADRFAACFSVRRSAIPVAPDLVSDARAALLALVARSRSPAVRDDMLSLPASGRQVGRAYASRLIQFMVDERKGWRAEVAPNDHPVLLDVSSASES